MSFPTITVGRTGGFMDDMTSTTPYVLVDFGLAPTASILNNDYFQISATPNAAGDEYAYYSRSIYVNAALCPYVWVRWKTSGSSSGLRAKIEFFNTISLASCITTLGFSSTWTNTLITLDPVTEYDALHLYADDYPDSLAAGTFKVWFDHVLAFTDTFAFPSASLVDLMLPEPRTPDLVVPMREGGYTQSLGSEYAKVHISADMDFGDWGTPAGNRIYDIAHNMNTELWQWLILPEQGVRFKARLDGAPHVSVADGKAFLDLHFIEYKVGGAKGVTGCTETYTERFGITT